MFTALCELNLYILFKLKFPAMYVRYILPTEWQFWRVSTAVANFKIILHYFLWLPRKPRRIPVSAGDPQKEHRSRNRTASKVPVSQPPHSDGAAEIRHCKAEMTPSGLQRKWPMTLNLHSRLREFDDRACSQPRCDTDWVLEWCTNKQHDDDFKHSIRRIKSHPPFASTGRSPPFCPR